ncbi:MAG: hypothetical protein ACYTER_02940 [Planctomycetota bacterium]|jgi:hypothetical protein
MSTKKNFLMILESQVDKIVLVVMVLISLALLWLYVLSNPYAEKVGSKKLSPGNIDKEIKTKADLMLDGLEELPETKPYQYAFVDDFKKQLQCSIPNVSSQLVIQFPGIGDTIIEEDRLYDVPVIPALYEVQKATLRGTVRVPLEGVSPGNPYNNVGGELSDLDQVTISGRFDVQSLYNNFQVSFAGPSLKSTWKDPKLATPVFAKMDLQRRVRLEDGLWGDWQQVPRTKIDMYHELLGKLPTESDQMQFGVNIWMSQYEDPEVQLDILQPQSYQFAISKTKWIPPEYLNEAYDLIEKEKEAKKRQLREERMQKRTTDTDRTRDRGTPDRQRQPKNRQTRGGDGGGGGGRGGLTRMGMMMDTEARNRPTREKKRTVGDVQKDADVEMLKATTRLGAKRDPLLVWAHDDTTQPGRTYQYRIRLGVFNPIMGKNWFRQSQTEFKDQIVLWSAFSGPTEPIEVPRMLHIFPTETLVAKDGEKTVEGAKVEVAKYHMGQWKSFDFDVYPGQVIGGPVKEAELQEARRAAEKKSTRGTEMMMGTAMMTDTLMRSYGAEEEVDFTTPMVMVDMMKGLSWGSRILRSTFDQILYSEGDMIVQLPVGKTNWPKSVRSDYNMVQEAMEEAVDSSGIGGRMGRRGDDMMMQDMMMNQ